MKIHAAKNLIAALPVLGGFWLGFASVANAEWVPCAGENGYCATPFPTIVRYGAYGRYSRRRRWRGGIPCNNGVFGDPIFGVVKHCEFWAD
jgi:hypothetical protein